MRARVAFPYTDDTFFVRERFIAFLMRVAEYHRAVADWVDRVEQGVPPFASPPEVVTWLGGIAKAGHLEA